MELILKYFSNLSAIQKEQFEKLRPLYEKWNAQINVISRKDIEHFYERHVLHSLAIAKFADFQKDETVLDIGTGGGFPGIPLAIYFPETQFTLVDSIGKKIKVVQEVAEELNLKNVKPIHARAENLNEKFDHISARAVTQLKPFFQWTKKIRKKDTKFWLLKGGDLSQETAGFQNLKIHHLNECFEEGFFDTKKLIEI